MNAKERFLRALRLKPVDRPPVAAVTTGITVDMMESVGVYWPSAHTDLDQLVRLAESIVQLTDIETIKLPFCMTVEVEAMGARVNYRDIDTLPTEQGHIYNHPDELSIPADFFDRGRVPLVLEAISRLRKRYDGETAVISSIVGPFSLAAKLFGFQNFLTWLITDPDWVHTILSQLTPLAMRYAAAQANAGADAITIGEASCSGNLISARMYRDFIAPYHRQLCESLSVPTILHICGRSTRHLPYIAQVGASAYSFDEGVDISAACQHLKGRVALAGYVPAVDVLLEGEPELVYQAATNCLENGVDILTPGCSLPPHTSFANIQVMAQAAHDWPGTPPALTGYQVER